METQFIKPWFIIREPGLLKKSIMSLSEVTKLERFWASAGLTVIRINGSKILLVGSFKWIEQFISLDEFDQENGNDISD